MTGGSYDLMEMKEKLARLVENQSELARVTGIKQSALSKIIRGEQRPYLDQAFKIARAIGVSLDYLADDTKEEASDGSRTDAEEKILLIAREMGPELAISRLLDLGESRPSRVKSYGEIRDEEEAVKLAKRRSNR